MDPSLDARFSALLAFSLENEEEKEEEPETVEEIPDNAISNETLRQIGEKLGRIYTCFPQQNATEFEGRTEFPQSYLTLSLKEKLLLLFAENFRRQFREKYPHRKPLVYCLLNECGIQKFVSTTIRPAAFLFHELIHNWEGIALFVADHIAYEPLEEQVELPTRLLSPETVLKRRKGNCVEIATLLASLLVGNGFPACVVYGYATREVVNNDQRRVVCPFIPTEEVEDDQKKPQEPRNKYDLVKPPKLESKFEVEMEEKRLEKMRLEQEAIEEEERRKIAELEALTPDEYQGHRVHAWVAIIRNAQWSYKPEDREKNAEGELLPPHAFFIEPSTGFRHEVDYDGYLGIECIWNQHNYYVNIQKPITNISSMRWDVSNARDWEHLLTGEPFECRNERSMAEDLDGMGTDDDNLKEKHLDLPFSWVNALDLTHINYVERYVGGEKTDFYKRAVYERFAPYVKDDGLVKRLTLFETLDYENPYYRWEWYKNRIDLLQLVKIDFRTKQIEEYFEKGRADAIQAFFHNVDPDEPKIFKFYHAPRFDALRELHIFVNNIFEHYEQRSDRLYYREFKFELSDDKEDPTRNLYQINERFHRNHELLATRDIAEREFYLNTARIFVKFHYDTDCITASTRIFQKLPESEMGEEVEFNPDLVTGYISNPNEKQMTSVELYQMLLKLQKEEERSGKAFNERWDEIQKNLATREVEFSDPKLKFSIFDPLRNEAARQLRIQRYEQMRAREELAKTQLADFLAPYLVRFEGQPPTAEEAEQCKYDCLTDFKRYYLDMFEELRARYEELIQEEESLRKFLHKFQSQFDDFEYEKFIKEGESILRNKRIVSKRMDSITEELNRKYNTLKDALENDERLKIIERESEIDKKEGKEDEALK